jgi:N-acetylglutamate synthase-like GNAT family acetyltransferase
MATQEPANIRVAVPGVDEEAASSLVVEYLTWAHTRLAREYGVQEPPADPAEVLESLAQFRAPTSELLLVEVDGQAAGVGALRFLRPDVAEIKRMFVAPSFRGRRIGAALLDRLLADARAMGSTTELLDTCCFMTDAQRLYRSRGFEERDPYEGTEIPERLRYLWLFFERGGS